MWASFIAGIIVWLQVRYGKDLKKKKTQVLWLISKPTNIATLKKEKKYNAFLFCFLTLVLTVQNHTTGISLKPLLRDVEKQKWMIV